MQIFTLPPSQALTSVAFEFVAGLCFVLLPGLASAQTAANLSNDHGPRLSLQFSPYTYHVNPKREHSDVFMLGLEREFPDARIDGVALFRNSFGQPTVYFYPWGGVYKSLLGIESLSYKWSAGLLYGYKKPYEHKVPLNFNGFSPALILGLSYEFKRGYSIQANMLGTAAVMFQLNVPLNR